MINEKPIQRLSEFLELMQITPYAFEVSVNISNGYFAKQLKKGGAIGSGILQKINEHYKMLDIKWLITGEGSMLIQSTANDGYNSELATLKEKINSIEKNIADLKINEQHINT